MISQLRRAFRKGLAPGSWDAYGFAVLCFAVATLIRLSLNPVSPNIQSFATDYPAVLFAALVGGGSAGLIATGLSAIVGWWAFLPPYFTLDLPTRGEAIDLTLFIAASLVIVWGAVGYRQTLWRLNEEEQFRKTTADELAHRVKNNLATVIAILRRELRAHPDIWAKVFGRLNALAATDEFIRTSTNHTASLRDILAAEVSPYDSARFFLSGQDIQLTRKLAITLALLLHELATNAAKYGALSNINGHVVVSWTIQRDSVQLIWTEHDGPKISIPNHRGFGLTLLQRGLASYGGTTDLGFSASGVSCKLSFSISECGPLKSLVAPHAHSDVSA